MPDESVALARRRGRRRRRIVVGAVVAVLVVAGAGTAWATRSSGGPAYRLTTVSRSTVTQTVDADGSLAARKTAALAFAAAGTVASVGVAVGTSVDAGQTVATIGSGDLEAAVTSARATIADAQQKLADDEDAQAAGTTTTSGNTGTDSADSGGLNTDSASIVLLTGGHTSAPAAGTDAVSTAQQAVVSAQHKLDSAVAAQDHAVQTLVGTCSTADETAPTTVDAVAGDGGSISGSAGSAPAVVTLRAADGAVAQSSSPDPQRVAAGSGYSFAGLTAGTKYTIEIVRSAVIDSDGCVAAVGAVSDAQHDVDSTLRALDSALATLTKAVSSLHSSGAASGGSSSGGSSDSKTGSSPSGSAGGLGSSSGSSSGTSGSGRTRTSQSGTTGTGSGQSGTVQSRTGQASTSGSGQTGSSSTRSSATSGGASSGTLVTSQRIAADAKSIDAAKASLAVARANVGEAHLTSPIAGTVAAVALTKGDTVRAASTTSTITVVGTGALSVDLSIPLSDIDLVKLGQQASVTVDGHSDPYPATVSYVGVTNTAGSTGSSAAYTVSVQLGHKYPALYDGMGASVAISVGAARDATTVPLSAMHTIGTQHLVDVYSGGKETATRVTIGLVGPDRAQITSGLRPGQRVVLADIDAAVPSPDTSTRGGGSFAGLTGGTGRFGGAGGGFGGGRPGGR